MLDIVFGLLIMEKHICNYCNKEIGENTEYVVCDRCHTLYHRDCWIEHRKCVLCGCVTCKERNVPSKVQNKPKDVSEFKPYYEEELYPTPEPSKFKNFLYHLGCFLYASLLCFVVWYPFHYYTAESMESFEIFICAISLLSLLFVFLIIYFITTLHIDISKISCCVIPILFILLWLFFMGDLSAIVGGVAAAYAVIYFLLHVLRLSMAGVLSRKIVSLFGVLIFTVLLIFDCIMNFNVLSFKSVINTLFPFIVYFIYVVVILNDDDIFGSVL